MTFLQVFNKHVTEGVKVDYDVVKAIALEYAEVYSKQVLEIAAKEAKLDLSNIPHKKGYPYLMVNQNPSRIEGEEYFVVDQESITNIQLSEHT